MKTTNKIILIDTKMKYIYFLQDLSITREKTVELVAKLGGNYTLWASDAIDFEKISNEIEIIVTSKHKVDSKIFEEYQSLKMVSLAFTGHDEVDKEKALEKGIHVYYVPDYATNSVVELILGLTLSLLRKIHFADKSMRMGNWDKNVVPGIELANKKIGIIGTGNIGVRTAKIFTSFGCKVFAYSRTEHNEFIEIGGTSYVSKEYLLTNSDIIVLCLPLDKSTTHFIGKAELDSMKKGVILINASRGNIIEETALFMALDEKKISAGIDVFSHEPLLQNEKIYDYDNLLLTPHIGFKTKEALERLSITSIENIGRYLNGNSQNRLVPKSEI